MRSQNNKDKIKFLAEYGKFDSKWSDEFQCNTSCTVMLQSSVFKNLMRNIIINASLPQ